MDELISVIEEISLSELGSERQSDLIADLIVELAFVLGPTRYEQFITTIGETYSLFNQQKEG